jgi:hypothetical protein
MKITRDVLAQKLADYLRGSLPLEGLVDWAENAMLDGDFSEANQDLLTDIVARLGLADVRAFGLTWEDCRNIFRSLGVSAKVDLVAA